jgi:phosphomannomutase
VLSAEDTKRLEQAEAGISAYLQAERDAGRITGTYYDDAVAKTMPNLRKWLSAEELDQISPNLRDGLRMAIDAGQWVALTNAYSRDVSFGTGGIREKMGAERDVVLKLKEQGLHAPIIKGPNTINDVVLLMTSAGVAKYGVQRKPPLTKVVIGYDSRVRGQDFAKLIGRLFLAYDWTVYLFDEACMYPSVTYAVPTLKADVGVFISASHNDFRYNGYKLSCWNGSQFDPAERAEIYENFIRKVEFSDIKLLELADAPVGRLWFLGGVGRTDGKTFTDGDHHGLPVGDPLPEAAELYAGKTEHIIDLHSMHIDHVKSFLLRPAMVKAAKKPLSMGFSAFNGSGRKAVPRVLEEVGFQNVRRIMTLDALDGMFPAFCSDPGHEQQPDPGDWRAADVAVEAFKKEYPDAWSDVDLIVGTDPDADRCGVIVKVPEHQAKAYPHAATGELRDYALLSADDCWSLILWYRLQYEVEKLGGVQDVEKKFITLSHTTTDLLTKVALKYGLGVLKTWVGFAQLAAGTRAMWDLQQGKDTPGITENGALPPYDEGRRSPEQERCNRSIYWWANMDNGKRSNNIAALEQSNGFSLLGDVPRDERSLGVNGHVRDKDGTFAAVLVAELAQYAKEQGIHLLDLLDEKIYLDPDIGLFVTYYEPDPMDGEYEGLAGYTKKRGVLDRAEDLFEHFAERKVTLAGLPVHSVSAFRTGKYDAINWPGFPDEGYRFYLSEDRQSHATLRPSGTSNALRFHVQLYGGVPTREELLDRKATLRAQSAQVVTDLRGLIGAPR